MIRRCTLTVQIVAPSLDLSFSNFDHPSDLPAPINNRLFTLVNYQECTTRVGFLITSRCVEITVEIGVLLSLTTFLSLHFPNL